MLTRWLERSGIGQFLAPDENAAPVNENDEAKSVVWQYLAPDENFSDPTPPPLESFPPTIEESTAEINSSTKTPKATTTLPVDAFGTPFHPQTPRTPATAINEDDLNNKVMSACRDTAASLRSPMPERKINEKFLRLCGNTLKLQPKSLKRMRAMIEDHNFHDSYLFRVRSTRMGVTVPDGYTPLMAAAYAGNMEAAQLLLELAKKYQAQTGDDQYKDLHLDTDMFGMTALHIAAEGGHVEMIKFLCALYKFPSPQSKGTANNNQHSDNHVPLVDLCGQTAFGRAVTSPVPKAKKNRGELEKELFSKNDLSIFGTAKPMNERMGSIPSLGLHFGTADMPGMRGYMEDAMSFQEWTLEEGSCKGPVALFCVCDGHGDSGKVSDFVASNVKEVLSNCIADYEQENKDDKNLILSSQEYWSAVWEMTSLQLDRKLQEARLKEGGSTGVFALVTGQEIVVANVGDSRCILASSKPPPEDTKGDNESKKDGVDAAEKEACAETEAPPALVAEEEFSSSNDQKESAVIVTALSEDHKPNLPEEIARVKMAGYDVESIVIQEEDGTETVIHKVVKDAKEQLAVSRAFGDFDYKANNQLSELEQAVIPLADVTIHTRKPNRDLYLVLACDGIWDVMKNEEVIELVQKQVEIRSKVAPEFLLPDVADGLLNECLDKDSRDNLSAIVVSFQQQQQHAEKNIDDLFEPKTLDFGSPK